MKLMAPYTGGLLRLAFTTIGILAILAAAVGYWQHASVNGGEVATFDTGHDEP